MADMGGIRTVSYLVGFLAPQAQAQSAQGIGEHMIRSIQTSAQWSQMQQNVTANTSKIVTETNREISNTSSSSYWSRQKGYDEISRRRENAILDTVDVVDPETGQQFKVQNGGNYYWMDSQGRITGIQTYTRPSLDFRPLVQLS
jgi:hypothetical protein